MTRKDFLEAASLMAIAIADKLGLTDDVVAPAPPSSPPPSPPPPAPTTQFSREQYPKPPVVDLLDSYVAPGANEAVCLVRISKKPDTTVLAHYKTRDGQSKGYGRVRPSVTRMVRWEKGDTQLIKSFTFPVHPMKDGQFVNVVRAAAPDFADEDKGALSINVRCSATEPATQLIADLALPIPRFEPLGTLIYDKKGSEIAFSDDGAKDKFSTALHHGRSQPGNGETGYYARMETGNFEVVGDDLLLKSWKFDKPFVDPQYRTVMYHVASMLSGHRMTDTMITYGSASWVAKMPPNSGAWPALWALTEGQTAESDTLEIYGHTKDRNDDLSCAYHSYKPGGKSDRYYILLGMRHKLSEFGLPATMTSEFHEYSTTVTPEYIAWYIDGIERARITNPDPGRKWYWLMNVAVLYDKDKPYPPCEMQVRSFKVWKLL